MNPKIEHPISSDSAQKVEALSPENNGRREGASKSLPDDALIILPVRDAVLFPGIVSPLGLGRERSRAAAREAVRLERPIGLLLQNDPSTEEPGAGDLHWVGTTATVERFVTSQDGSNLLVAKGVQRFRVLQFLDGYPFQAARVQLIDEIGAGDPQVEGRARALKQRAAEVLELLPQVPAEVGSALEAIDSASQLADFIAGMIDIPSAEKQALLEAFDLQARLDKLLDLLTRRIATLKVSQEVEQRTRESIGESNRKHLLREQMKSIQKELGEDEDTGAELEELKKALDAAKMPEEVDKHARKELKRLERTPEAGPEYSMVRTYLEWLTELPWVDDPNASTDVAAARRILDEDHYGLEKIKRRIVESLAVRKLNPSGKAPILCFVGPPGVGKTSLGQSIAKATGRKFVRVSLGGTHDEAEIRGHRRTYVGALPGNIIQGMKKAGTHNPVMMLDEIDKLGAGGFHGDPASAMLEVLDPEQNSTFRDNYLGVAYDLSSVMFIATANVLDTIPGPLRDRMEVIQLPGYTAQEKLQIAKRYLLDRQLKATGLTAEQMQIDDEALSAIIHDYTREAGVRNLEREIGNVMRHTAARVAEAVIEKAKIGATDLAAILGALRFESDIALRKSAPGVATGLAWTPVGGDILFIEAARMPGSGKLILTGQLGDVMKESAQAAFTVVKSRAESLGIAQELLDKSDIHVHVPAGATPKDGPSAGVAMFLSISSLLTGRAVRSDVAMTGEITLRGLVTPIGGVKEKVLAALRAGIKTVMLPERNKRDLEDIPADARAQLTFHWIGDVDAAMLVALEQKPEAVAV
ncbi:MAG: endopeptidase La [Usitatibacter sp.]